MTVKPRALPTVLVLILSGTCGKVSSELGYQVPSTSYNWLVTTYHSCNMAEKMDEKTTFQIQTRVFVELGTAASSNIGVSKSIPLP